MSNDITEQEFIDGINCHKPKVQQQQTQAVSWSKGDIMLDVCFTVPACENAGLGDESNENHSY